jgi:hypothetical protein
MTIYEEIKQRLETLGLTAPIIVRIMLGNEGIVKADIQKVFNELDLGEFNWLQSVDEFDSVETEIVYDITCAHVLGWIKRCNIPAWYRPLLDTPRINKLRLTLNKSRNCE